MFLFFNLPIIRPRKCDILIEILGLSCSVMSEKKIGNISMSRRIVNILMQSHCHYRYTWDGNHMKMKVDVNLNFLKQNRSIIIVQLHTLIMHTKMIIVCRAYIHLQFVHFVHNKLININARHTNTMAISCFIVTTPHEI